MKRMLLLVLALALVAPATADDWHIETVDSDGYVGRYTSLALDSSGYPHISYNNWGDVDLKYAVWNGASWELQTVSSNGYVGEYTSLALDSSDHPHISYFYYANDDLKYADWNGASWELATVDSGGEVGRYTSLALDSSGNPHISYYDDTNEDLKYAAWNGASWQIETVYTGGDVGRHTSLALDAGGNPHISYYDDSNDDLKYAAWNGGDWDLDTVDWSGSLGRYNSLALDSSGNPHISYYDATNEDLKYAYWNGASWEIETVDSDGDVGEDTSLALDSSGYPYISYYDGANYDLKFATTRPDWDIEDVELTASPEDDGVLLGWSISGDLPAGVRVLRGVDDPVAVSGSLDGTTRRWLDRDVEPGGSYVYWLETTDSAGQVQRFGPTAAVVMPEQAQRLTLDEPWPNPAASRVSVAFTLPQAQRVSLSVYDLAGRRVATLSEGELPAGRHTVNWNCAAEAAGVYLLRLETQGAALSRRIVVGR